jgi:DedD protein
MAWFKFGKQDASAVQDAPVETVETMRTRAKRRLIGALILVVTAVVGFPLLFETQPRPALVDVPIEIPDKTKVKPLPLPPAAASAPAAAAKVDDKASLGGKEEIVAAASASAPVAVPNSIEKQLPARTKTAQDATKTVVTQPAPTAAPAPAPTLTPVPTPASDKSAEIKAAAEKAAAQKAVADKAAAEKAAAQKAAADKSKADAARAQALLDGKAGATATAAPVAEGRFIVQFGSFAEESKAREVRQKVEKAGLKTYAQVAETSEGKRHRVRVGPFPTRAEAEKAAAKIKALSLPANILTL